MKVEIDIIGVGQSEFRSQHVDVGERGNYGMLVAEVNNDFFIFKYIVDPEKINLIFTELEEEDYFVIHSPDYKGDDFFDAFPQPTLKPPESKSKTTWVKEVKYNGS